MSRMSRKITAKYRLGQEVFYIANGYVTNNTIDAIFRMDGSAYYSFAEPNYKSIDECYTLTDRFVKSESDVFPDKKSLIKSIEQQEDEVYE